jgi:hypothetical protein
MSRKTCFIIFATVMTMFIVSLFFPYQRFDIPIEHSIIVVRITGIVALGVSVACIFLSRRWSTH